MTETEKRLRALETIATQKKESRESLKSLDVTQHIAPVYMGLHDDINAGTHQYYNLPGGRGSGKSSFVSLEIVAGIMKDETGDSNAIIFRRTGNTLRDSVYSQIAWAIDTLGAGDFWRGSINPLTYTFLPTGAQILFRGLDDTSKLKSIKPRRGFFRFIWIEEFSELPGENFARSVMQSVVRGGAGFSVFRTFNPSISKSNWANLFILQPDDRALTLRTTYLDMPADWLGDSFIEEAERLRDINPAAYTHEYLGEAIGAGGEVFPNVQTREITDDEIESLQYVYSGVDFGFSSDPAVYIRLAYDSKHDAIYIIDEIYKKHCSNAELAAEIKARGYDRRTTPDYIPIYNPVVEQRERITCDSAEPKSINDLRNDGLLAVACKKYPGSVLYGIKWLQNRIIIIDPKRTPQAYKEFINYEYEKTKDGEFLADVPDCNNHTIDAARYALDGLINGRKVSA